MDELSLLLRLTVGLVVLAGPGLLVASQMRRGPAGTEALVALGWGAAVVPTLAFFVHLFTGWSMSWPLVAIVGLAHLAVLPRRWPLLRPRRVLARLRSDGPWLLACLGVGLLWLLHYDRSHAFNESCIHTTALIATGDVPFDGRLLFEDVQDARLGNTALLSAFAALFGQPGFRLLYGVCGALFALGGGWMARSITGRRGAVWFGLLLPLNPYVASIPLLDENVLTLAFSLPALPLLLGSGAWGMGGVLFGIVVAMRHVMILAAPAPLLAALLARDRGSLLRFAAAFVLTTLPENLHHYFALGSFARFESNGQFPAFTYGSGTSTWTWQGMLGWPLGELIRTPGNPFPTSLLWPLSLADHWGAVLSALILIGAVAVWRRPREALFWALWFGPAFAALSVQEAWDVPNKMGVIIILFPAVFAWLLHGVRAAAQRPPVLATATLWAAAIVFGAPLLRDWRVPPDHARYQTVFPGERAEQPYRVDSAAVRATDIGWGPDWQRAGPWIAPGLLGEQGGLAVDIERRRRAWGWPPGALPAPGEPVVVEIDLGAPWHGRRDFARLGAPGPVDVDLTAVDELAIVPAAPLPWDPTPAQVWMTQNGGLTVIQLFFSDWEQRHTDRPFVDPDSEEQCVIFGLMAGIETQCLRWDRATVGGSALRIRTRAGGLSLVETVNRSAQRMELWRGVVSPDGLELRPAIEPFHN